MMELIPNSCLLRIGLMVVMEDITHLIIIHHLIEGLRDLEVLEALAGTLLLGLDLTEEMDMEDLLYPVDLDRVIRQETLGSHPAKEMLAVAGMTEIQAPRETRMAALPITHKGPGARPRVFMELRMAEADTAEVLLEPLRCIPMDPAATERS